MTVSDELTETWQLIGYGFSSYEASDGQPDGNGKIRSVDRVLRGGRECKGQLIASNLSTRGYPKVTIRDDDGNRVTIEVHALQMLAFDGPCPPGKQVRHWNDIGTDNRWAPGGEANCGPGKPGNLVYGTPKQNAQDWLRNNPPAPPKPPRLCACGRPVTQGSSKRCHDCVVQMGVDAAALLGAGLSAEGAARELGYSSPDGLVKLAVKYGGWSPPVTPGRRSRGVMATLGRWLRRGDRA